MFDKDGTELTVTNGEVTVTDPAQLANLDDFSVQPFANSDVDFNLTVTATSGEAAGGSASVQQTLNVTVNAVADDPNITVNDQDGGVEDQWIPLDLQAALADTDGSETLSITISNVPSGALLSPGADQGGGVWIVTPAELPTLCILPPDDFSGEMNLVLNATSTEAAGGSTTISDEFKVTVAAVADAPTVLVQNVSGDEDTAIDFTGLSASLNDTDGSETLSVTIAGIPGGAKVFDKDGTELTVTNGEVTVTDPAQLGNLDDFSVKPPANSDVDFNLTVTATSTEGAGGSASVQQTLSVTVNAVADAPTLTVEAGPPVLQEPLLGASEGSGFGSGSASGSASGSGSGDDLAPASYLDGGNTYEIPLDVQAGLTDTDGSEVLSVTISSIPDDVALYSGDQEITVTNGAATLTPDQLADLTLVVPEADAEDFTFSITATSRELANGDTATKSTDVSVDFDDGPHCIVGTWRSETLTGTDGNDKIIAGYGADTVLGLDGDDVLQGEGGKDSIEGGAGDDTIEGGADGNILAGGEGDDTFIYEGGNNNLDVVSGGADTDRILGGDGDDTIGLRALSGVEEIDGGDGTNIIAGDWTAQNFDFSNTTLTNIDQIDVGHGADTVIGSDGADNILGGDGDDTIGLLEISGVEEIDGGGGVNVIAGDWTAQNLDFSNTTLTNIDEIDAGHGADTVIGSDGADNIRGGGGQDSLEGGAGADTIDGGSEADDIFGNSGDDLLIAGRGDDVDGGLDTDTVRLTLTVDEYNDPDFQAELAAFQNFLTTNSDPNSATGQGQTFEFDSINVNVSNVEKYEIEVEGVIVDSGDGGVAPAVAPIVGTEGDDRGRNGRLAGTSDEDTIVGLGGDDDIRGGGGDDALYGDNIGVDAGTLTLQFDGDASASVNTFGSYKVDEDGNITGIEVHVGDASSETISVSGGDKVGFFVIADGNAQNNGFSGLDVGSGRFEFRDTATGNAATVYTIAPALVFVAASGTETALIGDVFHSAANEENGTLGLNPDGTEHTGSQTSGNSATLTFDDLLGGGANDDASLTISVSSTEVEILEPNLPNGGVLSGSSAGYDDDIKGGSGDDTIFAGAGDDDVRGEDDDDVLYGESGDDKLRGGDGDDFLLGGVGDDSLKGERGDDDLAGGIGEDTLKGGHGDDTLHGGGRHADWRCRGRYAYRWQR